MKHEIFMKLQVLMGAPAPLFIVLLTCLKKSGYSTKNSFMFWILCPCVFF